MNVPDLKHHDAGWVVIRLADGEAILEIHRVDRTRIAEKLNFAKYKLVPVSEHLATLTKRFPQ